MMSIREAFAPFRTSNGLISDRAGQGTGNGLLYASEYMITLSMLGQLEARDQREFTEAVRRCEIEPGLYNRAPDNHSGEAWDDYIGLIAASYACDLPFAREILAYGKAHNWTFNNLTPGKFDWRFNFGRNWSFIGHAYFGAREYPPLYARNAWAVGISTAGVTDTRAQDPRILASLMLVCDAWQDYTLCRLAVQSFRRRLRRDWPGGIPSVMRAYFGFEHPLVSYYPMERYNASI